MNFRSEFFQNYLSSPDSQDGRRILLLDNLCRRCLVDLSQRQPECSQLEGAKKYNGSLLLPTGCSKWRPCKSGYCYSLDFSKKLDTGIDLELPEKSKGSMSGCSLHSISITSRPFTILPLISSGALRTRGKQHRRTRMRHIS
jgi:hypothetical protein